MPTQNSVSTSRRALALYALVLLGLIFAAVPRAFAQGPDDFQAERQRAIQLINDSKFAEALPIFEKLAASSQADGQVMYGLGIALLMTAEKMPGAEAQRKARLRGREALVRAREMGVRDENLDIMIKSVKPNGALAGMSDNKEANDAMAG